MSSQPALVSATDAAPPTAPLATSPAAGHPLSVPHFRHLWLGSTVSLLGDQFYFVALPWIVLQLTGSSLALGTILMAAAVPRAALMLIGGAASDRFSARRVLLATATTRALLVGGVAALIRLGLLQLWHLYVLTFAFGVADAFSFPAGAALIPTVVEPRQLQSANSVMGSSAVVTQMVGRAPAGLFIRAWGIAAALAADAVSFLAVIAALWRVPEPPVTAAGAPVRPGMLQAIGEGLRVVRADPPLWSLMVLSATLNFCVAGPIGVGLATMAKLHFGSAAAFGTCLSCFSGGTLVGLLLGGRVKRPRRRGLQVIAMSAFIAIELISIGLVPRFAAVAALLALMGLAAGLVNVQFSTWVQMRVESSLMGRVMSVLIFAAVGLTPVSYMISGFLAQWSLAGMFLAAGALLAVISMLALSSKAAREID
jgi:MFS family permease